MSGKHEQLPDYYQILGVHAGASQAEIANAFHALAHKHHPDTAEQRDPDNQRFKEVMAAYQVLADPQRRRQYDRRRHRAREKGHRTVRVRRGPSVRHTEGKPAPADDIYAELPVSPEEARDGTVCQLRVTRRVHCSACRGTGTVGSHLCADCHGLGRVMKQIPLKVPVPAGVRTGMILRVLGEGSDGPSPDVLRRGNLYLRIVVRPCW